MIKMSRHQTEVFWKTQISGHVIFGVSLQAGSLVRNGAAY